MQTVRILQAVVLMTIIALAASCAATKEYASKLFVPRSAPLKDTQLTANAPLRFLELDSAVENMDGWVTSDIIMGRDTSGSTYVLDNFAKSFPPGPVKKDTLTKAESSRNTPVVIAQKKNIEEELQPVARAVNAREVRSKRRRDDK